MVGTSSIRWTQVYLKIKAEAARPRQLSHAFCSSQHASFSSHQVLAGKCPSAIVVTVYLHPCYHSHMIPKTLTTLMTRFMSTYWFTTSRILRMLAALCVRSWFTIYIYQRIKTSMRRRSWKSNMPGSPSMAKFPVELVFTSRILWSAVCPITLCRQNGVRFSALAFMQPRHMLTQTRWYSSEFCTNVLRSWRASWKEMAYWLPDKSSSVCSRQ